MKGPVARSEKLVGLFNQERLDPASAEIVAVAIITETTVADMMDLSTGHEVDMAQFLAGKIIPQYQPKFIPAGAKPTPRTRFVERRFKAGESLESYDVNRRLAEMLADVLDDDDLDGCTALALIGASPALGETRLAVVAKAAPVGVTPRRVYTKPIMGSIVGTYEEYDAPDLESARSFLASKPVMEPCYYVEIYTPEGGIGKDCEGTYEIDAE